MNDKLRAALRRSCGATASGWPTRAFLAVVAISLVGPAGAFLGPGASAATALGASPLSEGDSFQVPPRIDYCTYFGGSGAELLADMALGPDGSIYLLMDTTSRDLPVDASSNQTSIAGGFELYVCRLSPDGSTVLSSTYIGGSGNDFPEAITVDGKGCAYVVGYTASKDFPTTPNALKRVTRGVDGLVVKLSADMSSLEFSTYLGGDLNGQNCFDVVWDPVADACVVAGRTDAPDFPTTSGAYDPKASLRGDAFVCGLSTDGSSLRFSTFLGGDNDDEALCLALADDGDLLVGGQTRSSDFPTTSGAFQGARTGFFDCVVSRLDGDASQLLASTYLGGSVNQSCLDIAEGPNGSVVVSGETTSSDFPTSADAADPSLGGVTDAWLAILDSDLGTLGYGSYLGGSDTEYMEALAVDALGDIYLSGYTYSADFPVSSNALEPDDLPGYDAYLHVLDTTGNGVLLSTYLGGDSIDTAYALAFDADGTLVLGGWTGSTDLPVTDDAYQKQHAPGGGAECYVVTIPDLALPRADAGEDIAIDQHATAQFNGTATADNGPGLNLTWTLDDGPTRVVLYGEEPTHTFHDAGSYPVELNVTDAVGNWAHDTVTVTVRDTTPPAAVIVANATVDQGAPLGLDGTASTDNVGVASWTWTVHDHDGAFMLSGPTATYVFAEAGAFRVDLNATDAAGNWAVATVDVAVRDTEPPRAEAGADVDVSQGEPFVLNGSASTDNVGVVNWTWTAVEGGAVLGYGQALALSLPDAGALAVRLAVRDAEGNADEDTLAVLVRDTTPPVARAGDDAAVDQHAIVVLDGSASTDNVGIASWTWRIMTIEGWETLGTGPVLEVVLDRTGQFTFALKVADAAGGTGEDELVVAVRDTEPPVAEAGHDIAIDQGATATFDGSFSGDNVGIVGWEWTVRPGEGPTPSPVLEGKVRELAFSAPGTHLVELRVTDAAGNWANDTLTVTVRDTVPPVAEAGPDLATDQHVGVRLDGRGSPTLADIANWTWRVTVDGSPVVLYGSGPTLTIDRAGVYEVTLEVRDPVGHTSTDHTNVTVRDTTSPVAVAPLDMRAKLGAAVLLNGSASSDDVGVVNWTWEVDTGDSVARLYGREATATFARAGNHSITLTVRDAAGNEAQDVLHVVVAGEDIEPSHYWTTIILPVIVIAVVIAVVATVAMYIKGRRSA